MNTWTQHEVTTEITCNVFDCYSFGGGILVGWRGHTTSPYYVQPPDQPLTGHPFFGLAWYCGSTAPQAALNIYANSPIYYETVLEADATAWKPVLGVKYVLKFRVQPNNSGGSHYSLKIWPVATAEPAAWNLQADGVRTRARWCWPLIKPM